MKQDIASKLNKEQLEAVTHLGTPLLIIAGAGTGKTTVIANRIAWLIQNNHAKPNEILALTYTEKAADEMIARVADLLETPYADLWISTFHAFCQRVLNNYAIDIGLPDKFRVLDKTSAWMLMHENLNKFELDYYRPLGAPHRFIHALLEHFGRAKDEAISPNEYLEHTENIRLNTDNPEYEEEGKRLREIANAYHKYNQLLLDNNFLDFGDLLVYTHKLFNSRIHILNQFKKQFKYILVDEFQDTNWIQYEIVKKIAGNGNGFCVVADDDQSIYKFRGASVANVLQFSRDFENAKQIALIRNYRSAQEILDLSHSFIQNNNPNRLESRETCGVCKKLLAQNDYKGEIMREHFASESDEIQFISNKIKELRANGKSLSECAILTRTNQRAREIAESLERNGIPVIDRSRAGLLKDEIILDCYNWFLLLDNHYDSGACYRIMRMNALGLLAEDLMHIVNFAKRKQWSYVETLKKIGVNLMSEKGNEARIKLLNKIDYHTSLSKEKNASEMAYQFFEEFGLFERIASLSTSGNENEARRVIALICAWFALIDAFEEQTNDASIHNFLRYVGLMIESGDEGSLETFSDVSDAVKIMTIHASKGLEFDFVFIPGLVHLRFPTIERKEKIQIPDELVREELPEGDIHLEEERRLMYVALTRARKALYLSFASDYGNKQLKKPSIFIHELGFEFSELKNTNASRIRENKKNRIEFGKTERSAITSFSFSALNTFKICPLKYKYGEILKIPRKGAAVLSFGTSIHTTLQRFYELLVKLNKSEQISLFEEQIVDSSIVKAPTLDELLLLYEENFLWDWFDSKSQKQEYFNKGKDILKRYYEDNTGKWIVPKYCEKTVNFSFQNNLIRGKIDRVDPFENGFRIVDYKTGHLKKDNALSTEDKQQLLMYQLALQQIEGLQVRELCYEYLDAGEKITFNATEKDIEKLTNNLSETILKIQSSDFSATPSPHNCMMCEFRSLCEFREI